MSLRKRLVDDMKTAMKTREKLKLSVLRMAKAAAMNQEIERGHELDDDEFVEVLTKEVKLRRDSLDGYKKADKPEIVETIEQEISILMEYLPTQMTESEIKELVKKIVLEVGADSPKDMGKVMGKIVSMTKGRADGKVVSELVKSTLNGE
ncbi:MAG: GatB/YqeY domain-containing protein [Clostridia bacterium]|nr:GatB/YqeY domain-containing protein [Clostridia bacterium]MDD4048961.1 GatB/YqeY domain-containing protein [Clostridia bacterium]